MESKTNQIDLSVPVYISIDKDVLDESISETNWSQGHEAWDIRAYAWDNYKKPEGFRY